MNSLCPKNFQQPTKQLTEYMLKISSCHLKMFQSNFIFSFAEAKINKFKGKKKQ